jgi:hypothetical protein
MSLELVAQIAIKRIGADTYCIVFKPSELQRAYDHMANWCLNPDLNFGERAFTEMAREMADNDPVIR